MTSAADREQFSQLQARWRTLLPAGYRDRYEEVQPTSMGSAGLQYDSAGRVAWDSIWRSFCDLALAGGPPHRGRLLQPGPAQEIAEAPERYQAVVEEICRGIGLVTGLGAEPAPEPGWIRLYCTSAAMVGWLMRAIVMENVSARCHGLALWLPAGPGYRVEKEIKNVVTVVAKTCHYWLEHMSDDQHQEIAQLLRAMQADSPLVPLQSAEQPSDAEAEGRPAQAAAAAIEQATGLQACADAAPGWLGVECADIPGALCRMRLLSASNVLSRREGTAVFVPLNPAADPAAASTIRALQLAHRLAELWEASGLPSSASGTPPTAGGLTGLRPA